MFYAFICITYGVFCLSRMACVVCELCVCVVCVRCVCALDDGGVWLCGCGCVCVVNEKYCKYVKYYKK